MSLYPFPLDVNGQFGNFSSDVGEHIKVGGSRGDGNGRAGTQESLLPVESNQYGTFVYVVLFTH